MPRLLLMATLAVYTLVMYSLGFLVGNGYSVDLREPVIGKPVRLSMDDLGAGLTHVAARVWGRAYVAEPFNSTEPVRVEGYHFTLGNITCVKVEGAENVYECRGEGYILRPVGYKEEFLRRGEKTRYYYSGWLEAALYSTHQAYYTALLLVPAAAGLAAYALYKLFYSRKPFVYSVSAGLAVYIVGALHGLVSIPSIIASYLDTAIAEAVLLGTLTMMGSTSIAYQLARGWRRRLF